MFRLVLHIRISTTVYVFKSVTKLFVSCAKCYAQGVHAIAKHFNVFCEGIKCDTTPLNLLLPLLISSLLISCPFYFAGSRLSSHKKNRRLIRYSKAAASSWSHHGAFSLHCLLRTDIFDIERETRLTRLKYIAKRKWKLWNGNNYITQIVCLPSFKNSKSFTWKFLKNKLSFNRKYKSALSVKHS